LWLDWQKPRRASLLPAVCRDHARNRRAFVVTTSSRSATLTKFYRRAVSKNAAVAIGLTPYLDKFLMTSKFYSPLIEKADAQPIP
jgi:hypothetical protein